MFSNPVRQMPYISNFRGLLFYGHLSNCAEFVFVRAGFVLREVRINYSVTDLFLPYPEWKRNDKMYSRMPKHSCCEIRIMQSMTYFFCAS